MHDLEYQLLQLSIRIRRGTISTARLAEKLRMLASYSHDYIPDPELPQPEWDREGQSTPCRAI
jgi:hypothetical protein